jgi:hypothetical protein
MPPVVPPAVDLGCPRVRLGSVRMQVLPGGTGQASATDRVAAKGGVA